MAATYTLSSTTLPVAITADATHIKVASVANIVKGQWLVSQFEAMQVERVDGAETPYPKVLVTRGVGGSFATAQPANTTVYIGTGDQFYQKDPIGAPAAPPLVLPYINTSVADGGVSLWTTNAAGTAWITQAGFGGGNVLGPASSTDTAVPVFDGTTGTLLKNTGVKVDSSNNVTGMAQASLTTLAISGVAFASLPAAPVAGMVAYVTDSNTVTWGATIAGSSTNKVLAFYNGTNWTVAGK